MYLGFRRRSHNSRRGEYSSDDERILWPSGGWWGLPGRGPRTGVGPALGANGDPSGAKRRCRLHLRRRGRHLRRVAGARGHRNLGRIRACPRYGGSRGQRAGRGLLPRPSAPRTPGTRAPGALQIVRSEEVVNVGWPLMEQGRTPSMERSEESSRSWVLIDDIRVSLQEIEPHTRADEQLYAEGLDQVQRLADARRMRL